MEPSNRGDITQFDALFRSPDIQVMLNMTPQDFEKFVQFVFECAGYGVAYVAHQAFPQGPGVDLNLHAGPTPQSQLLARVEVRRYTPPHLISLQEVAAFIGLVNVGGDIPGFMVTTSDFTPAGYAAAQATNGRVRLINSEHLVRYISYIGGSRFVGPDAPRVQGVQRIPPTYLFEADMVQRLDLQKTMVLAVANNKGGVAKTTTSVNIALTLADQYKKRVLLIDMDPQSSLTRLLPSSTSNLAAGPPQEKATLTNHFGSKTKLAQIVRDTHFDRIWVVPANDDLGHLDKGGGSHPQEELSFSRAIHDPQLSPTDGKPFDWIIIDTPPAQAFFTRLAMGAAHRVLVPASAETLAVLGARRALEAATAMHALVGPGAIVTGSLVTRWKKTAESQKSRVALDDLFNSYGTTLFPKEIPDDAKIEKAHLKTVGGFMNDLFHLAAQPGPAAQAYMEAVKELLSRIFKK